MEKENKNKTTSILSLPSKVGDLYFIPIDRRLNEHFLVLKELFTDSKVMHSTSINNNKIMENTEELQAILKLFSISHKTQKTGFYIIRNEQGSLVGIAGFVFNRKAAKANSE